MRLATRIDTVFLPAVDPSTTADWYRDLFGVVEIFRAPDDDDIGLGFEGRGKAALTLVRAETIDREAHARFNVFAPDIDALHGELVARGVEIQRIGQSGAMRYFDFRDPSGHWIGVYSFPESD